jgi:class 3 adenylate cyclase
MLKIYFKYSVLIAALYQIVFIISAGVIGFLGLISMLTVTIGVGAYGAVANYLFERYLRQTLVNEKLLQMEKERLLIEREKSEELLNNLLPSNIAKSLKNNEHQTIAERYSNVTVMFAHIVGLNRLQDELEIKELFKLVNTIFCKFDDISDLYKIEKIKTIGSSYMVASGLDQFDSRELLKKEVCKSVEAAIAMMDYLEVFNEEQRQQSQRDLTSTPIHLNIRVGIHIGPVVAGVIGKKKFVSVFTRSCECSNVTVSSLIC